jgi:anaerobic ribonucleoside-triphosphate reductase
MADYGESFAPVSIDPVAITDSYLDQKSWRTKENSTSNYSIGGLVLFQASTVASQYWLHKVYTPEIANAHKSCDLHLHDLQIIAAYCAGWGLKTLLEEGLGGVPNKINSGPAKHLNSAMQQIVNYLGILQLEWNGAQAFNSFDTYLAPFIRLDKMTHEQIRQCCQTLCYGINTPFLLADGTTSTFKEFQDKSIVEADVLSYDESTHEIVRAHADHIGKRVEDSEMIEVELEDGTIIQCDPEQKILTSNRGWVAFSELTELDDVLSV